MTYPINPTDGEQTNVNGVIYTYSAAIGAWVTAGGGGSLIAATDISATGNVVATGFLDIGGPMSGASLTTSGNITTAGINATDVTLSGSASLVGGITVNGTANIATMLVAGSIADTPIIPRVTSITSSSVVTIDADTTDQLFITNLATDVAIEPPGGTPVSGQKLTIRILDDGNSHNIAWDPIFVEIGTSLPLVTIPGKYVYVGMYYNTEEAAWDVVSVAQQN